MEEELQYFMEIKWSLHVERTPEEVYEILDSSLGRSRFWAESAEERSGEIQFVFINGVTHTARILERRPPTEWSIDYFGGKCTFRLLPDGQGGTDVRVTHEYPATDFHEVSAGWLNVLLPLKAWAQFGIDLRNHDPDRTWDQGYVDQ